MRWWTLSPISQRNISALKWFYVGISPSEYFLKDDHCPTIKGQLKICKSLLSVLSSLKEICRLMRSPCGQRTFLCIWHNKFWRWWPIFTNIYINVIWTEPIVHFLISTGININMGNAKYCKVKDDKHIMCGPEMLFVNRSENNT